MTKASEVTSIDLKPGFLPLMEHFYTIQGEGFNAGKAAYFLRLGGCDVGCVWCDVKESWDASIHPQISELEMLNYVKGFKAQNVVITGGEPLMYDLNSITQLLHNNEFKVWIETSGAYELSGNWDWVCLSPKKFKKPVESIYQYADELKIIVYNKSDFQWAQEHAAKINSDSNKLLRQGGEACKLYLQAEWSKEKEMLPLIIDFVKENPQWTISLQTHKYLNIP
jgi:7-carboxy-7-deazaguanine synthase